MLGHMVARHCSCVYKVEHDWQADDYGCLHDMLCGFADDGATPDTTDQAAQAVGSVGIWEQAMEVQVGQVP